MNVKFDDRTSRISTAMLVLVSLVTLDLQCVNHRLHVHVSKLLWFMHLHMQVYMYMHVCEMRDENER